MRLRTLALLAAVVAVACAGDTEGATTAGPGEVDAPSTTATSTTSTGAGSTTTTVAFVEPHPEPGGSESWSVEVIARSPHDPEAFTQGLLVDGDIVYESTGLYGMSSVRSVDRATGSVLGEVALSDDLFGEGLELVGDRLIQLTWREGTALVWDAASLEPIETYTYEGEGWGLCHDGARLVMSDGSSVLQFRDPAGFARTGTVEVTRGGVPVTNINELECVGGLVFANVWLTDEIVVIDPGTGLVVASIDAAPLAAEVGLTGDPEAVLNGIAYDSDAGVFLLTGKLWPALFEVRFVEAGTPSAAALPSTLVDPGVSTNQVDVGGFERMYRLFVPEGLEHGVPAPLVIDLHGFTSNPDAHDSVSGMRSLAAERGFVVAQPAALGAIPVWDPSADNVSGSEDVAFIRAVVDDVARLVPIDTARVFATGFSNGGGLAHRLACDAADLVAAIGTVSGAYVDWNDCDPAVPVAVIGFHGTSDFVAPYAGAGSVFAPVPGWAADWANRNDCAAGPVRREVAADVYAEAWSSCNGGADVVLFTVQHGLHSWPGSPDGGVFPSTRSISATETFWEFFAGHGR